MAGEDPLEEEMATHSSILAWRIPWTEEPGELQPMGSQSVGHDSTRTHTHPKEHLRDWDMIGQGDAIKLQRVSKAPAGHLKRSISVLKAN